MKITPKQYAVLLYELTKDIKKSELKQAVQSFIKQLARGRALSMLPRILELYNSYYNAREGAVDVEVTTAQGVTKGMLKNVGPGLVPGRGGAQGPALQTAFRIDPSVLGGARIRVGDYMIDDTLKTRLKLLKQTLYHSSP